MAAGHIVKRGKRYSIVLEMGKDGEGKRKQKWIGGYDTKAAAKVDMTNMLAELHNGSYVVPSKMTTGEWFDEWERKHSHSLAPGTKRSYLFAIKAAEDLRGVPLQKLTSAHLEGMYAKWQEGGLKPSTIGARHNALHAVFSKAEAKGYIARNPAKHTSRPRLEYREPKALSRKERERMLAQVKDTSLHMSVLLALATGMRQGELLALRWQDIDLDEQIVRVCRSLDQSTGTFKEPKSKKRRLINLPASVIPELTKHKAAQDEQRLFMGANWHDHDLVLTRHNGDPIMGTTLGTAFVKFARDHGFGITFHGLRHTYATHLLESGVHPKVVQELLGHANITETMNIYSHVLPGMGEEAAAHVDKIMAVAK